MANGLFYFMASLVAYHTGCLFSFVIIKFATSAYLSRKLAILQQGAYSIIVCGWLLFMEALALIIYIPASPYVGTLPRRHGYDDYMACLA